MISADDSPVKILVIANNDERLLAWETLRAIERSQITLAIKEQPEERRFPSRFPPTTSICRRPMWTSCSAPAIN